MGSKGCKLDYEGAICSCGFGCKYRDERIATLEARVKELEGKDKELKAIQQFLAWLGISETNQREFEERG